MSAHRFLQTKSADRIHCEIIGEGPPLILLHSNGGSARQYADCWSTLALSSQVVAIDLPGQGDSAPLQRHWSVGDYAEAVIEVMDLLGLARAHVVGTSIGGAIALKLGAAHADRVGCLGIVEAPARDEAGWEKRWNTIEQGFGLVLQSSDEIAAKVSNPSQDTIRRWNIDRSKAGAKTMMDVMWALRTFDVRAELAAITAPTLLVYGDRSPVGEGITWLKNGIPGARLEMMTGCGHFPMLDAPDTFANLIVSFLASSPLSL